MNGLFTILCMNRITGKPITLALYSDINMLSKDLFEVQDS